MTMTGLVLRSIIFNAASKWSPLMINIHLVSLHKRQPEDEKRAVEATLSGGSYQAFYTEQNL